MYRAVINCTQEKADLYSEVLFGLGASSVSRGTDGKNRAVLDALFMGEPSVDEIENNIPAEKITIEKIEDDDWKDKYLEDFTGHKVHDTLYVYPHDSEEVPPEDVKYSIKLDARGAFGDGRHPATSMCVSLINRFFTEGDIPADLKVLDAGTGSGILAIYSSFSGADQIDAFDICPEAVERARYNAGINKAHKINVSQQDLSVFEIKNKYDLVIANLQSEIIEKNISRISEAGKKDCVYILSGIGSMNEDGVKRCISSFLKIYEILHKEEWVALYCRRFF